MLAGLLRSCRPPRDDRAGAGGRRRCAGFLEGRYARCPPTPENNPAGGKQANVLAALPKSTHPGALAALKEIYNAKDIDKAQLAIKAFEVDYSAKYPEAVAKIVDDADVLLEFYKYPAKHLGSSSHYEPDRKYLCHSTFEDESHQGTGLACGWAGDGLQAHRGRPEPLAQGQRPELVALVRAGAVFHKGKLLERAIDITPEASTAEPQTVGSEAA